MKILVALLCTVLLVSTMATASHERSEESENKKAILMKCAKENDIDLAELRKLWHERKAEEMPNFGCFFACVLEDLEIIVGNVLNESKIYEKLSKFIENPEGNDKIRAAVTDCKSKAEAIEDRCERAKTYHKCVHESIPFPKFGKHRRPHEDDEEMDSKSS